jgi:hypothetical protein
MITYCEMNGLPLARESLIMALVSLNIDEEKIISFKQSKPTREESYSGSNVIKFPLLLTE